MSSPISLDILISFVLNKCWPFLYHGRTGPACARFLAVIAVAYLLNLVIVFASRDPLHLNSYLVLALGSIPYTMFGYLGSRFFAFPWVPNSREHAT